VSGEPPGRRVDARRLWAGGLATAVVAALVAVAGVLVARGVFDTAVLAPQGDGVWGNANTPKYALSAAVAALVATALLHILVTTTPRPGRFFTWVMVLLTAIVAALPLTLDLAGPSAVATSIINIVIGTAILSTLIGVARTAVRRPHRKP